MRPLAPIGRILFALIFILSAPHQFQHAAIAAAAAHGTPAANVLVPLSGILALVGGLSVALGLYARLGAVALAIFLIPVTLVMHKFWGITDPNVAQMQLANFLKNTALLGGAIYFVYAGAGAFSFDARLREHHGFHGSMLRHAPT